jgi:RimJ/RimL family protein N-acetyltransferase
MKAPLEVVTSRLILLRPERGAAREVFERYASDREVTRFLGWPRHTALSETEAFLSFSALEWERWPAGPY